MNEVGHNTNVPEFIVTTEGEVLGHDTPENREIVRRIHACVNACQDISTEELEGGIINDMRRVLSEVVPVLQGNIMDMNELNQEMKENPVSKPHFNKASSELEKQKHKFMDC